MKINYKTGIFIIIIVALLCTLAVARYLTLENNKISMELNAVQNELSLTEDELVTVQENLRAEIEKNNRLQKEYEEANSYIEILIDEKYSIDYMITNAEVEILTKTVWGEARGCNKLEQSAVIWCILNRVDAGYGTIIEVVTEPNQFHGYNSNFPVDDETKSLVEDVIARWKLEKTYGGNFGRTLPSEYLYFSADESGISNIFRTKWTGDCEIWDWNCWNPYLTIQN